MSSGDDKSASRDLITMGRISALCALTILGGVLAQGAMFTVNSGEVALVARFGRLVRTVGPGLHLKYPFGVEYVETISTAQARSQSFGYRSDVVTAADGSPFTGKTTMITLGSNIVELSWEVRYQVSDPVAYLSSVRDPERFLRDASELSIREIAGRSDGGELAATSGQEVASRARGEIQRYLDAYHAGISVSSIVVGEVSLPASVRAALDRVEEAKQEKGKLINNANQVAAQRLLEARGQATKILADAETQTLDKSTQAIRESNAFDAAYVAFRAEPETIRKAIYLDTLRAVLPRAGKIIVVQDDRTAPQSQLHLNEQVAATGIPATDP